MLTNGLYSLFFSFALVIHSESKRNNLCKNYRDYFFKDFSKNCYYSPDVMSEIPEILPRYVPEFETHRVVTEDGYKLTVFRIPKKNPKGVIVLKHQLYTSAISWILSHNESFAFLLSNQGYDVWLPNFRGTPFSQEHINPLISNKDYWNFDLHEYGLYDYPAVFDHIKNETGRSDLICIGHSASSTGTLVYASLKPEHASKSVKIFIEMSPAAVLGNIESPTKVFANFEKPIRLLLNVLGVHAIFNNRPFLWVMEKIVLFNPFKKLYTYLICFFYGWTPNEADPAIVTLVTATALKAFSTKFLYHYLQLIKNAGKFSMYDYGEEANLKMYNSAVPPEYPLQNISVPIYLIYSSSDSMTGVKDAELLFSKLPPRSRIYGKMEISGFNHLDFIFGKDRYTKVYKPIMDLVNQIISK